MNAAKRKIVVAGLIALALAFVATVAVTWVRQRAERQQALHTRLDAFEALRQRDEAKFAALNARLDEVGLSGYLTAQRLASAESMKAGRLALAHHRELLAERERLSDESAAQLDALVAALPRGRVREDARFSEAITVPGSAEVRRRLSVAMAANADAVQAVFDWVDHNQRYLRARDDRLLIAGQSRIAELDGLQYTVNDSAKAIGEAISKAKALDAQAAQALDRLRRDVDR